MGPYLAQPITQKKLHGDESKKNKLRYAVGHMQGWRRGMQDASITQKDLGDGNSLFAVFDGHGGPEVAKYAEKVFANQLKANKFYKTGNYSQALSQTFKRMDEMIASKEGEEQLKIIRKRLNASSNSLQTISLDTGCTANVVLITPNKIYTANAGDSRSVLCSKGAAIALSFDHKPQNAEESKRIYAAGGTITYGRIQGGLNLSRSLGDFNYKQNKEKAYWEQMVTCKPDVTEQVRNMEDQFILIGCDGIWERYLTDAQPLVTRVWNELKTNHDGKGIIHNMLDSLVAKDISEEIGCDNMTLIIVQFIS